MQGRPLDDNSYDTVLIDLKFRSRQINNIGFDLVLPGSSKTPLKPQKSGRVTKTPQRKPAPKKSSVRISKPAKTPAKSKSKDIPQPHPVPLAEINESHDESGTEGEEVLEAGATKKKRKLGAGPTTDKPAKRAKKSTVEEKPRGATVRRGRPTKVKPATSAGKASGNTPEAILEDELSSLLAQDVQAANVNAEDHILPKAQKKSSSAKTQNGRMPVADQDVDTGKRRKAPKEKTAKTMPAAEEKLDGSAVAPKDGDNQVDNTPPKRSIGQQSMKTKKRPSIEAQTVPGSGPKGAEAASAREESVGVQAQPRDLEEKETPIDDHSADVHNESATLVQDTLSPRPKQRKKRKPIAQASKPRKLAKTDKPSSKATSAIASRPDTQTQVISNEQPITLKQSKNSERKPLANVTNVTKLSKPSNKDVSIQEHPGPKYRRPYTGLSQQDCDDDIAPKLNAAIPSTKILPPNSSQLYADVKQPMLEVPKAELSKTVQDHPKASPLVAYPTLPHVVAHPLEPSELKQEHQDPPQPSKNRRGRPPKNLQPQPSTLDAEPSLSDLKHRKLPTTTEPSKPAANKSKADSRLRRLTMHIIANKQNRPLPTSAPDSDSDSDDPLSLEAHYRSKKATAAGSTGRLKNTSRVVDGNAAPKKRATKVEKKGRVS